MGAPVTREGFFHEALFYSAEEELLEKLTSFLRGGIEADEPTLVVLSASKIEKLRAALNGDSPHVEFADMAEVGSNPARIIPAWRDFIDRHSGAGRLRGVGEPIWAERSAEELTECQRHESLLNVAFDATSGFHLVCPYDTSKLPPDVLEEACRSHPYVSDGDGAEHSGLYRGLEAAGAPHAEPLPDPPPDAETCIFDGDGLSALRELVLVRASDAGFTTEMAEGLQLAVDEVASNSLVHGGGGGVLRIWRDGTALICEVSDRGTIDRPLAGRVRPKAGSSGGYGLWLANQLCDLVQVRSFEAGSVVRLHMRRARRVPQA